MKTFQSVEVWDLKLSFSESDITLGLDEFPKCEADSGLSQTTMVGKNILTVQRNCYFSNAKVLLFIYQLSHMCYNIFSTGSDVSFIVLTQIQLW